MLSPDGLKAPFLSNPPELTLRY